jgi:predicted deacylase
VLGITACVHGNELNGIPLIHRLFRELNCAEVARGAGRGGGARA